MGSMSKLSVKSILGHELEKEHHEALKDYMQKSKDSLEPMDNRVYEVMQKHLDKQQERALKNLDSTTQSVGVNAIKEQNKANENAQQETKNSQAQETTSSQAYESVSQANTQDTTQANESIKPQTNNTVTQQENTKENQEKTPSKGNDEPWIEHGKRMQEKAKAHYQACLEKERAKQNQQNTQNTIENQNKEVPTIDYGYTQNTPAKSRRC